MDVYCFNRIEVTIMSSRISLVLIFEITHILSVVKSRKK